MASFEQLRGMPNNLSVEDLAGYVSKISKELNWLLNNLDDLNITSLSAEKIIAGTVLVDVNMSVGSGNDIFKVDEQGIYLGNASFALAPFSVDMEGTLYATNAYIEGTVASSEIVGGTITIGSENNVFKADANGIYAGNASFAIAPFAVDMFGNLYATNATIQGDISSSTIEGGTITGAVIATDFSGNPRMELSGSGFLSYDSDNQKEGICVETGDYGYSVLKYYQNDVAVGGIEYNSLGEFSITALGGADLYIHDCFPRNVWNCASAVFINLRDGSGNDYVTDVYAARKGVNTDSDSHSHTVEIGGITYTTSSDSHSHGQN